MAESTEPAVPRRHRRRERHRRRGAGTDGPPAGTGGAPGEYAGSEAPAPVEEAPAGKDRRRFRRRSRDAGGKAGAAQPVPAPAPPVERPPAEGAQAARPRWRPARRPDLERGLRGIVGAGPSQVGVVGAMRARDASRPTAEDLAAAERDMVIVRRHYLPPDADPRPS